MSENGTNEVVFTDEQMAIVIVGMQMTYAVATIFAIDEVKDLPLRLLPQTDGDVSALSEVIHGKYGDEVVDMLAGMLDLIKDEVDKAQAQSEDENGNFRVDIDKLLRGIKENQ
jgi:hypothetical protein